MGDVVETQTETTLKRPLIWGVKRIVINKAFGRKEVHDIYEKLERYKAKLEPDEVIEEAKLRVTIHGDVKFKHVQKYLERFFDYNVHKISFKSFGTLHFQKKEISEETVFGTLQYKIDHVIEGLTTAIQKAVEEKHPLFRDVFDYLSNKIFIDWSEDAVRLFDQATAILLVNSKNDTEKRKTHCVVFGCQGDCQPQLELTSEDDDYTDFIRFFRKKGYSVRVNLCVVTKTPKTRTEYFKRRVEGFETKEQCAVL